jgi:hypothetical protein
LRWQPDSAGLAAGGERGERAKSRLRGASCAEHRHLPARRLELAELSAQGTALEEGRIASGRQRQRLGRLVEMSAFAEDSRGALRFHPLASLSSSKVADLLQVIRIRVLRWLARHGVIEDGALLSVVEAEFAERDPALAALARAAVSGLAPAGPERRQRPPIALGGQPGVAPSPSTSIRSPCFGVWPQGCGRLFLETDVEPPLRASAIVAVDIAVVVVVRTVGAQTELGAGAEVVDRGTSSGAPAPPQRAILGQVLVLEGPCCCSGIVSDPDSVIQRGID